jgi:DNA (cytosine-5)-methyltransferase 1
MLPLPTRALCALQGFPDSFRFYGNVHAQHRQIGNAVPPPLAAALGRQLRMVLENKAAKAVDAAIDAGLADI